MLLSTPPYAVVCCCFAISCCFSSAFGKLFDKTLLSNKRRGDYYGFFIVYGQILAMEASYMSVIESTVIFSQKKPV